MNKKGMTLAEVIVSAVILALTVGGMLYIFTTERGAVAISGRNVQALDFAQQTLEELKNAVDANTYDTGALQETDADWDGADAGDWQTAPIPGGDLGPGGKFAGAGRSYRVRDKDVDLDNETDYKEVEVVVDWTEPVGTQ
jgi:type II secretory pathway pseudopilin PulG